MRDIPTLPYCLPLISAPRTLHWRSACPSRCMRTHHHINIALIGLSCALLAASCVQGLQPGNPVDEATTPTPNCTECATGDQQYAQLPPLTVLTDHHTGGDCDL